MRLWINLLVYGLHFYGTTQKPSFSSASSSMAAKPTFNFPDVDFTSHIGKFFHEDVKKVSANESPPTNHKVYRIGTRKQKEHLQQVKTPSDVTAVTVVMENFINAYKELYARDLVSWTQLIQKAFWYLLHPKRVASSLSEDAFWIDIFAGVMRAEGEHEQEVDKLAIMRHGLHSLLVKHQASQLGKYIQSSIDLLPQPISMDFSSHEFSRLNPWTKTILYGVPDEGMIDYNEFSELISYETLLKPARDAYKDKKWKALESEINHIAQIALPSYPSSSQTKTASVALLYHFAIDSTMSCSNTAKSCLVSLQLCDKLFDHDKVLVGKLISDLSL